MVAASVFWIVSRGLHPGLFQIKPTIDKMSALGAEVQSAGGSA